MLQDQITLVTGASRGIGRAIALELGRQGATVIGTATTEAGAQAIGSYLREAGIKGAGRDIWTLIDSRIQRWKMSVEGAWEELVLDQDVSKIIATEVRTRFTRLATQDDADLDLEFLDLQVVK